MLLHLRSRYLDTELYSGLTVTEDSCTFMLWNLTGQLVGYQSYNPSLPKLHVDDPKLARYYTHVTKPASSKTSELAAWGLETVTWNSKFLFLTEGVFDAARLHWCGLPAVAVLNNNPAHLAEWLYALPVTTVACVQGDKAGEKLAAYGQRVVTLPDGEDVGSVDEATFLALFREYLNGSHKN